MTTASTPFNVPPTAPEPDQKQPSFSFYGERLEAPKLFLEGTPRGATPGETLARLKPYWEQIGLTRLADITGLDRIGIPVTLALRPNSPDIGTNAGKGLSREAALASAAMEALEHHCGETFSAPSLLEPYQRLQESMPTIPLQRLALSAHSLFRPELPERWCFGWDLIGDRELPVPYEQVKVAPGAKLAPGHLRSFQTGTNGLASGNSLAEAVVSALLELVERDSIACHLEAQDRTGGPLTLLCSDTITFPAVLDLIERFRRAGVELFLFDLTTDLRIPVFHAAIFSQEGSSWLAGTGWGAGLDSETALIRALTEAAQTRLIHIYGARDDLFRRKHEASRLQDCRGFRRECALNPRRVPVGESQPAGHAGFEEDIAWLAERLMACGLDQIIVLDLTPQNIEGLAAARVIVPGLEGYRYESYRPGERARSFAGQAE